MQDRKLAFVNAPVDRRTVGPDRGAPCPAGAGAVIPAALVTGIRSDLPGQITAQVTENVYDSPSGRYFLVPQDAKLIGVYDSQIAFGQSRVLLVWNRLILPDGRSIVLARLALTPPASPGSRTKWTIIG
jgi:type IV secretory pathway VirB10-like protein